jgi:uncharacterized protein (DUF1786 family)
MMIHRRIKAATARGEDLLLTGVTMGGGPSTWAAEGHLKAGHRVFATPDAGRSFHDNLEIVKSMGVDLVSEEEAAQLGSEVGQVELRDFDFPAIARAFEQFGVSLSGLDALAIAVFDHGHSPPDYSERQFRFDYLEDRLMEAPSLSAFAHLAPDIPPSMTRLLAVTHSAGDVDAPLVVMDTAPAAVLGAYHDPRVREREEVLIANVGNMHTLAFRLQSGRIVGLFEHHTGLLDQAELENLLLGLAQGTLQHEDVFGEHGHGALVLAEEPLALPDDDYGVAVTGPRRSLLAGSRLRPYFAAPFGDMMIAGCFGLLAAAADLLPEYKEAIQDSFSGVGGEGVAPWDL